jgi:hypothetical protein
MFGRFLFSFEGRFSASLSAPYGFLDALLILQKELFISNRFTS